MFPGVTPSHLKRRSESHSSSPLVASSTSFVSSKKRPSTSHASGHKDYAPSVASTATSSTVKVRYPYTVLKNGKKHHAFPTDIIPYPLNYDNRILDAFILDSTPIQSHSASNSSPLMATSGWKPSLVPTIHTSDPSTHPKRVLDLGCGTGAWCVAAAQVWPYTQFTGLDMVAIQSVPSSVGVERIEEVRRPAGHQRRPDAPHTFSAFDEQQLEFTVGFWRITCSAPAYDDNDECEYDEYG